MDIRLTALSPDVTADIGCPVRAARLGMADATNLEDP